MNNFEIIAAVEKVVAPHFKFNMVDFYGNRGSCDYPNVEELQTLFFKLDGHKSVISQNKQKQLVDAVVRLNVGNVELSTVPSFGKYIVIKPNPTNQTQTTTTNENNK